MRAVAIALAFVLVGLCLAACKDMPGADGRYATRDRGQNNRGSP